MWSERPTGMVLARSGCSRLKRRNPVRAVASRGIEKLASEAFAALYCGSLIDGQSRKRSNKCACASVPFYEG